MKKTAVIAIGGNSLIKDEKHQTVPDQFEAARENCAPIANMIEQGWKIAITHGNGPQVGFLLLRSELASNVLHTVPLDLCGAETQGSIGYMIQQSLYNELKKRGINKRVVTVVTQVVVQKNDRAFKNPAKPIGPFYDEDKAGRPFVGEAGKLLTRIIEAMGVSRKDVYICNVVKCRPPKNRDPEGDEIDTCRPFLERQLKIIKPQVICSLGRIAGP